MMIRFLKKFIFITWFCLVTISSGTAGEKSGLLDGMSFIGNNAEKGRRLDPNEDEEIVFQNGLFRSVSCDPYDFESSDYSTTVVGNTIHFKAITHSPTHGDIVWKGVVDGNAAKVTFVWTKQRWYWDTQKEYWFKGVLKE